MKLTGEQREQIHDAILSGYDEPDLEQLVQFSLEQPLDHIARGRTLPQVVHALVDWAERNDRLDDLVSAAYKRSPDDPAIQQLWRDYSQWRAAVTGNEVRENRVSQMGIERGATPLWLKLLLSAALVGLIFGGLGWGWFSRLDMSQPNQSTSGTNETVSIEAPTETPNTDTPNTDTPNTDPKSISIGQTVTGTLSGTEGNEWIFDEGPADISITLDVGQDGNALIMILDAEGTQLESIDVQEDAIEQYPNYPIPDDEPYTIFVRNTENQPTDYTLTIERAP